jgi:hypothetical protein
MAQGSEAEHGVQRGEAGVAGADGVAALGLEVIQEGADELGVEILGLQPGRRPAGLLRGEGQQQLEGVQGRRPRCAGWPGAGRSAAA